MAAGRCRPRAGRNPGRVGPVNTVEFAGAIRREDLIVRRTVIDTMGRVREFPSTAARLVARLRVMSSGCIEWQGSRSPKGYGRIRHDGETRLAHRVAYALEFGSAPAGLLILHSCDNPPCCNPSHLRAGTPSDNTSDMLERGREDRRFNEDNPRTKLTRDDVGAVRAAAADGQSFKSIARVWGVHPVTVSRICRNLRRTAA